MDNDRIQQLAGILLTSRNTVFFGGAGVSTESGIPDFRSEAGLFHAQEVYGHAPEYLVSHTCYIREPELFYRYYFENLVHPDAPPNAAHRALAEWEREGRLTAVITQNVDGLHQAAGSRVVHELHGSIHRNFCVACGAAYDLAWMLDPENRVDETGRVGHIPHCDECGGIVKPDVVLYEEPLDYGVMDKAERAVRTADTLIVGGTSLVVYPAAGYVDLFKGKNLVFINKGETGYDSRATLILRASIGEVLSATARAMTEV